MVKKSKKKTVASTRKVIVEEKAVEPKKKEKKKILKKLLAPIVSKRKKDKTKKVEISNGEKSESSKEVAKGISTADEIAAMAEALESKTKEKIVKEKKPRRKLSHETKRKMKGGLLVLIGIFALSFIGYFLFGKLFRAQNLAELVAAKDTVGIVEVNVDPAGSQTKMFSDLLKNHPVYQKENFIKLLNIAFQVDFSKDVEPWLGRSAGLALVKQLSGDDITSATAGGGYEPVLFIESRDHDLTLSALKSKAMEQAKEEVIFSDYKGYRIYSYNLSQKFHFTFINNYLVIANDGATIQKMIDDMGNNTPRLSDDADYKKVANNLPQGGLVFAYMNMDALFTSMASDQKFAAEKGQNFLALKPFISVFKSEGLSVFTDKNHFVAQTFTSINKDVVGEAGYLTFSEKYQGDLLRLANEELILFAGGHDMTKELKRVEELFKAGTRTGALIFEGLLDAQKEKYFGKDIDLKQDIYPLFEGEYLLTVENNFEKPDVSLYLELKDENVDLPKLEKVVTAFIRTSGIFSPKVQDVTLPDGTRGKEIVASPEKVERSDENYNGTNIATLRIGSTGFAISYAHVGGKVAFSTNRGTITKFIDRVEGRLTTNLSTTDSYAKNVQSVLRTADQVYNVKMGAISEILGLNDNEMVKPYILPFTDFTVTKNFFTDGLSTIYLLEVI